MGDCNCNNRNQSTMGEAWGSCLFQLWVIFFSCFLILMVISMCETGFS